MLIAALVTLLWIMIAIATALLFRFVIHKEPMRVIEYAMMLLAWPLFLVLQLAAADFWDKEL